MPLVELELLQGRERAVARLGELEPAPVDLTRLLEHVPVGLRLTEIGQSDQNDARGREERTEDERDAHVLTGASAPS